MLRRWFLVGPVAMLIVLGGCKNDAGTSVASVEDNNAQTRSLVRVASGDDLEHYLKSGLTQASKVSSQGSLEGVITPPVTDVFTASSESVPSTSATNVIVAGVDEADLMKTDGRYLYVVKPAENVYIASDAVAELALQSSSIPFNPSPEREPPVIRISEINAEPASSSLLLDLNVGDNNTTLRGLYLATNKGGGDVLVAVGQAQPSWGWDDWISPWSWQTGKTNLWFFDVNEPAAPQQKQAFEIDGHLIASRRVGDLLYVVTRFTPSPPDFLTYSEGVEQQEKNRDILAGLSIDDLLPKVSINGAKPELLVPPERCFLPDTAQLDVGFPSVITLSVINLNEPEKIDSVCYGGNSGGFYATTQSMYFTRTLWRDSVATETETETGDAASSVLVVPNGSQTTLIHKFNLGDGLPAYQGSGEIKGMISGNPAFMMGEVGEVLHVITSSYGSGWSQVYRLSSLRQKQGEAVLEQIAHLPNEKRPEPIGKPGEQLYSSRFIGDRAYLVTFKKVDPLYVLDLSTPTDPMIAGELEIPGFSSYLHPIADNLLLGVGKDAVAAEDGDFAWYQGLKISLFDVADMSAPKELAVVSIGERGTETSLFWDYKAIAYLPADKDGVHRLTIPIQVHKGMAGSESWSLARWDHTGLYLFEVNDNVDFDAAKLSHTGTILKAKNDGDDQYARVSTYNDRAVIQGSAVHYIYDGKVESVDWSAVIID